MALSLKPSQNLQKVDKHKEGSSMARKTIGLVVVLALFLVLVPATAFARKEVIDVDIITGDISESTFYTYSSIPFSSGIIDDYFKLLLSLGFEFTSRSDRSSMLQVYNRVTDIIVGCAPDGANIFMHINVAL